VQLNRALEEIPFSPFEELERRIAAGGLTGLARLHQGKTSFGPTVRPSLREPGAFPLQAHEHAPPGGVLALRRRIAEHLRDRGRPVAEDDVVVSCGATQAVGTVLHAIFQPGDDVLILSPQWLFAVGLVAAAGGRPVEVPVFLELGREPGFDFIAALEARVGPRTRALYFNTPNNPTGYSFSRDQLVQLAQFAARRGLWIISDNAYENYDFTETGFIDIGQLAEAESRTFSVYTFSKTHSMPGQRVGYVATPAGLGARLKKWSLFSIYSLATESQTIAYEALTVDKAELRRRWSLARDARDRAARLAIPAPRVDGGLYSFLDLSAWRGGDVDGFIDECLAVGVTVAPGIAFGKHCKQFVRMCFTAVPLDDLSHALDRLERVYRAR
jgi:aspartate/methionine/tyrosine aminotransferase